jgi:hypothetical protein
MVYILVAAKVEKAEEQGQSVVIDPNWVIN